MILWIGVGAGAFTGLPRDTKHCRQWDTGARCLEGAYEINVRQHPLKATTTERSARIGRFLQLMDWPRCRYDTAWLDGHAGYAAHCDDGERAWIGRWWVVENTLYSQTVAGPAEGIRAVAHRWFPKVAFSGRAINAPGW